MRGRTATPTVKTLPPREAALALGHLDGGSRQKYAEMVEGLDRSIGQVLKALRRSGQECDTLVVFFSDNGGKRFSQGWPLSGGKSSLLEGGIRVPTIVRWPARVDGGQKSTAPVFTQDLTATFLEVAGARPATSHLLDGVSLAGYLLSGEEPPERDLFWRIHDERALRRGKWKYYRAATPRPPIPKNKDQLFDLEQDSSEWVNYAAQEPKVLADLKDAWESINADLLPYPEV